MPYTHSWDETAPDGSIVDSDLIDDVIRALKVDLRERMNALVVDWTADPVVPKPTAVNAKDVLLALSGDVVESSAVSAQKTIAWTLEIGDLNAWHAPNATDIVIPPGVVDIVQTTIFINLGTASGATGRAIASVYANGVQIGAHQEDGIPAAAPWLPMMVTTGFWPASTGLTIQARVQLPTTGTAWTIVADGTYIFCTGFKL